MRPPNVFAGPYLDRAAHLRKDAGFLAAARADPGTLLVPVWRSRSVVGASDAARTAALVTVAASADFPAATGEWILLGRRGTRACFAVEWPGDCEPVLPEGLELQDLRLVAGLLPVDDAGLLAYARAMVSWRRRHRYCGSCGTPTVSRSAGHVLVCPAADCGDEQFPRLDPAVIVLVSDGERALLGRQRSWPPGRYSTIAGFVEPGESLEDAVRREVLEETGVEVRDCRYHSSQPWPFPSSLMLGFTATADPGVEPRADEELEDVRWFSRQEVAAGHPLLPPGQSVSFRLIEDWFDAGSPVPLRSAPGARLWGASR